MIHRTKSRNPKYYLTEDYKALKDLEKIRKSKNAPCGHAGEKKSKKGTNAETVLRFFFFSKCRVRGYQAGECCLNPEGGHGKNQMLQRNNQLIQTDSFCTNGM